jgi:hypothetical protein
MASLLEAGGQSVLLSGQRVGRQARDGVVGDLFRVHLTNPPSVEVVHSFSEKASSLAVSPTSDSEIYFADISLNRLNLARRAQMRVEVDGLQNARAVATTPKGEIYVADHRGEHGVILQIRAGSREPVRVIEDPQFINLTAIDSASDGTLYVSSSSAFSGLGAIFEIRLPSTGAPVITPIWKGASGSPPRAMAVVR